MLNLLNTEFYKLFHSRYFWGIVAFNLFLSSVLLLDSIGETSSLFFASLYNVPILFFLAIVFSALFVGNDFGQRTLQSYIIAGHNRGQILLAKLIAYQIACITILALPLLVHGLIGRLCFKESFVSVSGNLYTVLAVVVSLFAMCLLPFFFALLFRDIGKTLADDILDEWRSSTLYFANIANGTAPTDCIAAIYPIYGAICFHRFFVDIHFMFWRLFGI